ncbi:YhjD/YihY/BrkB family envelope integrity protein [Fictibacillus sp. Mic-4]|uniref:YhjD/YihY/BrkB family envelope integrity protein n=1 Tax=Fictibacillus sp. Mic-4 TaxID=3132826 RepID=UPI003CF45CA1
MLVFFHKLKTRFFEDKVFDLSAQLAYYFLVSLFPFLFLLFTFLGFLPISTEDVLKLIQPYAPKQAFRLIEYNLTSILDRKRGELIYISTLVTTWLASMGILAIIRVFNKAYQVEESRPLVKEIVVGIIFNAWARFCRYYFPSPPYARGSGRLLRI